MAGVRFPKGFHWGTATAAYQIEGAGREDGKGESIWDRFTHSPGRIRGGDTGDVACDHYHRYREDVALMQRLQQTSYRFSIAWTRIQPLGRGAANPRGVAFYDRLIDALLAAGIRPFPTLYHWDLPQALQDHGGWPNRDTAGRFADYAESVARAFGDRVSDWLLLNEPMIFTVMGHLAGIHAPGLRDRAAFLRATHTANLAQADGYRAMKSILPSTRIGTAFSMSPCEPATDSAADREAAERFHRFINTWFLETALNGRYPDAFPHGLPEATMGIQPGDLERLRVPLDVVGINCYTRTLVADAPDDALVGARPVGAMGGHEGPKTDFGWEVWPESLHDIVLRITKDYGRPAIEITENGCSYGDAPDDKGRVRDERRIEFHRSYLEALARAVAAGADVRGYHAWSLMDNFEWSEGYAQRFGLIWVDFPTGQRLLKDSAHWYAQVAGEGGFA
ncbi:MAG: GH1 family beta-glucosidase [Myxococcota bacterium]